MSLFSGDQNLPFDKEKFLLRARQYISRLKPAGAGNFQEEEGVATRLPLVITTENDIDFLQTPLLFFGEALHACGLASFYEAYGVRSGNAPYLLSFSFNSPTYEYPPPVSDFKRDFNDLGHSNDDQTISSEFADFAKESFDILNKNCRYQTSVDETWHLPENFETGILDEKGYALVWHTGEGDVISKVNNFHAAIERFFEDNHEMYTIDCTTAQTLVLMRYMGKKREADPVSYALLEGIFAVTFDKNPIVNLSHIFSKILNYWGKYQNVNIRHITSKGCIGYFSNLDSYYTMSMRALSSQPSRNAHGLNVVSVGLNANNDMTYTGFSSLFRDGPKTYEAIRDYLLHHLCEDEVSDLNERMLVAKRGMQGMDKALLKSQPDYVFQQFDEEQDKDRHHANHCFRFA